MGGNTNVSIVYETITRSRRTLWSPNSSLEPKNEEIYLHRKKRNLHYRL
ncbi:MAG: hypothetical protein RR583_05365, partial [Enterococcus sp.]